MIGANLAGMAAPDISKEHIETALLRLLAERGKSIDPTELARRLAGTDETRWRLMMKPIRAVAVALARQGRVQILRKGKPADPSDFKGVYRIAPPAEGI
jgi:hypothetical protein